MGFLMTRTRFKAGQPISASALNRVAETAEKLALIQANPPLAIVSMAGGPILRYEGPIFEPYIAITTSTITARSGSTPGTGTAKVETWNGTALADLGGPVVFNVHNFAATSFASGRYCMVLRIAGDFWLISVEC